ncbi:MAG: FAD-binding protein [Fibrobacteres bacterium]|nr:FAD-binding protein [Fibrobacterota bacterium]
MRSPTQAATAISADAESDRSARTGAWSTDHAEALAEELRARIRGEVRFDAGARALYATDGSNYRQVPIGLIVPRTQEDVVAAIGICRRAGAPILPRGAGTSLAGQTCNAAVVFDFTKYQNGIVGIDPFRKMARVRPGVVLDRLREAAEAHGLTFGPDPATHRQCTLGGMIGNNSCGVHSVMAGRTAENVLALEVLTYRGARMRVGPTSEEELDAIISAGGPQGEIYGKLRELRYRYADEIRARMPQLPRRSSGFNLDQLLPESGFNVARALTGTEGTCVTVLEADLRLIHSPSQRALIVLGYPDVFSAAEHVIEIMKFGPIGLEGLDDKLVGYEREKGVHPEALPLLPKGKGFLMVELGADDRKTLHEKAQAMIARLKAQPHPPEVQEYERREDEQKMWDVREGGLAATARVPNRPDTWPGWEDSSVPPERLPEYLRALDKLFGKYGYDAALYGHFGQACIHCRIPFDLETRKGITAFRSFMGDAADLVVSMGGSLSGEHGDGQARAELLPKMYGEKLVQAFREFKAIWDPDGKMNPGKAIDANPITSHLRLGENFRPARPETKFRYPKDDAKLSRAVLRCVGVGACRSDEKTVMCPSYRATREEKHSTRGRARMLFEMLQGDTIKDGFRSDAVKESLDLCLACKGCKTDCPMKVDMATYKAEFLSGHYRGRLRPRPAYSMGLIYWWARLAARVPGLANFVIETPGLSHMARALGGLTRKRSMPAFAGLTFRDWYRRRYRNAQATPRRGKVLLWADTFNNYFEPEVAASACEVLEAAGFEVMLARRPLCCGRPLYDYGMLDLAKRQLRQILAELRPQIRAGVPVVGLEPSCVSVFRDELANMLDGDEDALRLSKQTFLLEEFLMREVPGYAPPPLRAKALVHGHCHQKSVLGMDSHRELLGNMGLTCEEPDAGCCGLAGSFGFEKDKHEVSMRIGELHLFPALRRRPAGALSIANGFSCRNQMKEIPGQKPVHLAQVLHRAAKGEAGQRRLTEQFAKAKSRAKLRFFLWAGAIGIAAITALAIGRNHRLPWTRRRGS